MNICIVGTGYVGLVTAACFAEMGNFVQCVDINPEIVENLKNGHIHIYEPGLEDMVKRNYAANRLNLTTSLADGMQDALFVFICVGTPSKTDGSCDMSYVHEVAASIGRNMQEYKVVVNKSTVPVGTANKVREIVAGELNNRGSDIEFDVVSNPEFLKEGNAVSDFMKPDRVIVGTDNVRTAELFKILYAPFAMSRDKLMIMGVLSAEMTKYAANCMLATKISFINEIANICEQVGADVSEVRQGIGADHRIGYEFIYPGPGYGGSCFPKDVRALIHTALDHDYTPRMLNAVDSVNEDQKLVLAKKIENYFYHRGGLEGKSLALWGLAFKANTDDMRESPAISIISYLTERGMKIFAFDPKAGDKAKNQCVDWQGVQVVDSDYEALNGADALAVVTEWNQFRNPDFKLVKQKLNYPVVFDGRNLYQPDQLVTHGLTYFSIGR
ncbi:MAG: UDP-glucose dehydrogenase family protein [Thermodesulfobacteriota bacterium]